MADGTLTRRPHAVRTTGRTQAVIGGGKPHRIAVKPVAGHAFMAHCGCGWHSHPVETRAGAKDVGLRHLRRRGGNRSGERAQAAAARDAGYR